MKNWERYYREKKRQRKPKPVRTIRKERAVPGWHREAAGRPKPPQMRAFERLAKRPIDLTPRLRKAGTCRE
jgi:hypothetical protein